MAEAEQSIDRLREQYAKALEAENQAYARLIAAQKGKAETEELVREVRFRLHAAIESAARQAAGIKNGELPGFGSHDDAPGPRD